MELNWLHITDLHCGMQQQGWLWPNVREQLLKDLAYLHGLSGPWDLILFTGDLTDRGTKPQFDELDRRLAELTDAIAGLQGGIKPLLFAVPGNHDLKRPEPKDQGLIYLKGWAANSDLRDILCEDASSAVRKTIDHAFVDYSAWWKRQAVWQGSDPRVGDIRAGLLPGDFSATVIARGGCRLGVLGLNTAFLQLHGGDFRERLALDTRQFHAACGGDGPAWAKRHNACLLITHHPPEWLDPDSRQCLDGEIANDGRFAAHLCGHQHEPRRMQIASDGNKPKILFLARSLFGLETYGDAGQQRLHGYAAGRIRLGPDADSGRVFLWPRSGNRAGAEIRIDRDPEQGLERGQECADYAVRLASPCERAGTPAALPDDEPAWLADLPADPDLDRVLAGAIDRELAPLTGTALHSALTVRLKSATGRPPGEALCARAPAAALIELAGAAGTCPADAQTRQQARRLFGLLLLRVARAGRPRAPLALELTVGSHAEAEILWARWQGEPTPAELKFVEVAGGCREAPASAGQARRIVGEGDVLGGQGLCENGWERWEPYVLDAKRELWSRVMPWRPVPDRFGPDEDRDLREALKTICLIYRRHPYYLTVDRQAVREPLNDPRVLDALRRDVHLPVFLIDMRADADLLALPRRELLLVIEQCVHAIDRGPR